MPSRNLILANKEYYHIFNRGVAKVPITRNRYDFQRLTKLMRYYQIQDPKPRFSFFDPKKHTLRTERRIVEIVAYCLMPNHFHFLLCQKRDNGISEFVSRLSNSYTKYFNLKTNRVGPLLQGEFKAVHIDSDEQLLHVSRYIHLNPVVAFLVRKAEEYPWSSYSAYLVRIKDDLIRPEVVLDLVDGSKKYKSFAEDHAGYAMELEHIKHLTIDGED